MLLETLKTPENAEQESKNAKHLKMLNKKSGDAKHL